MSTEQVISELARRSESRRQFERLLAFVLAPTEFRYSRSTWFRLRQELESIGLDLAECELAL